MTRSRISFDKGWKLHLGNDLARSRRVLAKGGTANGWSDLTKEELKAAGLKETVVESMGSYFQAVKLRPSDSDTEWQNVDLPHDWRIATTPSPDHPEADDYPKIWQGFFPSGVGYYRKVFDSPSLNAGRRISVTFDGSAGFSDIWLNGFWIGQQSTGYSPITLDITELLRSESEGPNVILVRADSTEPEGWWYEGGGIYRHVWLEQCDTVHIALDGVYVRTPVVSRERALVAISVEIVNKGAEQVFISGGVVIQDPESGQQVVNKEIEQATTIPSCGSRTISAEVQIPLPKLWDIGKGNLYNLTVNIVDEHLLVRDSVSTTFGVRTIELVEDGILVNGKHTKIYGGNIHQDWAVYGVALPDRIVEQKLELCAEMGMNAVRIAHHPPTPELVDHADRMGLLVLPENRLLSTSESSIGHLRSLIRRFRGRPSVFMWSIENEEMDYQGTPVGYKMLSRFVTEIKALDSTRPTIFGGVVAFEDAAYYRIADVVGMHYRAFFGILDEAVEYVPDRPHILDEEGLYPSTRGVYQYNKQRAYAGSLSTLRDVMMDAERPAANAALMPVNHKITGNVADYLTKAYTHPRLSGTFVWTALDYIGEPTPQRWPATTSSYGARDLCGLPKDYYWLLRALWRPEPLVHAFPHWTWPGQEGEKMPFRAYTNCDEVEFVINGLTVAKVTVSRRLAITQEELVYEPGTLVVRGFIRGKLVAEHQQVTASEPARLVVVADRTILAASGQDVALLRVATTDAKGTLIPDASHNISVEAMGQGRIVGVHNADPSTDNYSARSNSAAFNGFLGVYVAADDEPGDIIFTATADGLEQGSIRLQVSDSEPTHQVHTAADEAANPLFGSHVHYV